MLGETFRIIRVFNNMTQQELASKLNITAGYLSQIESEKRTPTLDTVRAFSDFFRIPLSSLMFFSEQLGNSEGEQDHRSRMAFGRRLLGALSKIEKLAG